MFGCTDHGIDPSCSPTSLATPPPTLISSILSSSTAPATYKLAGRDRAWTQWRRGRLQAGSAPATRIYTGSDMRKKGHWTWGRALGRWLMPNSTKKGRGGRPVVGIRFKGGARSNSTQSSYYSAIPRNGHSAIPRNWVSDSKSQFHVQQNNRIQFPIPCINKRARVCVTDRLCRTILTADYWAIQAPFQL